MKENHNVDGEETKKKTIDNKVDMQIMLRIEANNEKQMFFLCCYPTSNCLRLLSTF